MKTIVLYFTAGAMISAEQLQEGRMMGAMFRNAKLVDQSRPEACDFVAGGPIPECYKEKPVFTPEALAERLEAVSQAAQATLPAGDEDEPEDGTDGTSEASDTDTDAESGEETPEGEEVEITQEYLDGLDKDELLQLAEDYSSEFTLKPQEKKSAPKLRAALASRLIQE